VSPEESANEIIQLGTGAETLLIGGRFTFHKPCRALLSNFLPKVLHIKAASQSAKCLSRALDRLNEEFEQ